MPFEFLESFGGNIKLIHYDCKDTKWQKEKKISLNIEPSPLEPEATFRHLPLPRFGSHFFFLNLNIVFSLIFFFKCLLIHYVDHIKLPLGS